MPNRTSRVAALIAVLAVATLGAGCGGSKGPGSRGKDAGPDAAVRQYRAQALPVMTGVYDQLQPVEDAIYRVEHNAPGQSAAPLFDVVRHGDVPAAVRAHAKTLGAATVPSGSTAGNTRLVAAVNTAADAVQALGKALDKTSGAAFADALEAQQAKLGYAISNMSVEFPALFGTSAPPLPTLQRTAGRAPDSRAAYVYATAVVCGPAFATYTKMPGSSSNSTPTLAFLRAESKLVAALYSNLLALPSPPSQAARIEAGVRAPLLQQPQFPAVAQEVLRAIPTQGEAALSSRQAAVEKGLASMKRGAAGLRALGSVTCADLLVDVAED